MTGGNMKKGCMLLSVIVIATYIAFTKFPWGFLARDYSGDAEKIVGGYYYNSYGNESKIYYSSPQEKIFGRNIVDARVEEYRIFEQTIHVARRPKYTEWVTGGAGYSRLRNYCEFYLIDTRDGTVSHVQSDEHVKCTSLDPATEEVGNQPLKP
jgi:hypothetical protein